MNSLQTLEVLLRGIAVGAMFCTALGLMRGRPLIPARWTGALFAVAAAAFTLHSGGPETRAVMPIIFPIWVLSLGGTAYFWMFGMALFEDSRFTLDRWIPAAVMTIVGVAGGVLPEPVNRGVWVAHNILEMALILHIVSVIWRRREGDLVEARRALRAPVMLLIGLYAMILSAFEIGWALGAEDHWLSPLQAASLAVVSLLTAAAFLQARPELFVAARPAADPDAVDPQDRPALARLQALMAAGAWRREGLTIGQLAGEVGVPEHRLRRLINGGLGHRNFADFVGTSRIAAAKAALADPANARASISALAFDLGYASLGPFNRAFKDATGQTPSEWRVAALAGSATSP
jgi:AraC-like DNA-binding protein